MNYHIEITEKDLGGNTQRYYADGKQIEPSEYRAFAICDSRVRGSEWTSRKIGFTERGFLVRRFETMKPTL